MGIHHYLGSDLTQSKTACPTSSMFYIHIHKYTEVISVTSQQDTQLSFSFIKPKLLYWASTKSSILKWCKSTIISIWN